MIRQQATRMKLMLVGMMGMVMATALAFFAGRSNAMGEMALPAVGTSAEVDVVPMQMTPHTCGFVLVDKARQTVCLYEYRHHLPAHERLVLLAARSFKYDVELQDYNTAEPRPEMVKELLQKAQDLQKGTSPEVGPKSTAGEALTPAVQ